MSATTQPLDVGGYSLLQVRGASSQWLFYAANGPQAMSDVTIDRWPMTLAQLIQESGRSGTMLTSKGYLPTVVTVAQVVDH